MGVPASPPGPPRQVDADTPVRLVLVGGFLGAGKTTAICAAAGALIARGYRIAVVTNDQAADLVDTAIVRRLQVPVAEVAGGCFCCRFEDLLDAIVSVLPTRPDVVLCEPVGSCTDMAATVLNPLRLFYPDAIRLAPFTVLAEPRRIREIVTGEAGDPFGPEIGYLYRKQLEESDALLVSKCDTLEPEEASRLAYALQQRFDRPVSCVSALTGHGVEAWADHLMVAHPTGGYALDDLDYDVYAAGEATLGWLNAAVRLEGSPDLDVRSLLEQIVTAAQSECAAAGAEIAHMKAAIDGGQAFARAHLTSTAGTPSFHSSGPASVPHAQLTVNARVAVPPDVLQRTMVAAIERACQRAGVDTQYTSLRSFSPPYPRPPYRMASGG